VALSASTIWEVRHGGNDDNGGGFNGSGSSPGTDYSQQDAAQVVIDGATISATVHTTTTQITLVGHTVTAADNRNHVNITGGTATAGTYEITAVDIVNNRWTLDRSAGSSTQTVVGRMGGARAGLGSLGAVAVPGNVVYVKYDATPTEITVTTSNANGGPVSWANAGQAAPIFVIGYDSDRSVLNTDANRPTIKVANSGVSSISMFTSAAFGTAHARNLILDGNSKTSITGFTGNQGNFCYNCKAINCTTAGFGTLMSAVRCRAESCGFGFNGVVFGATGCYAKSCTLAGFVGIARFCIADSCQVGFQGSQVFQVNCIAYNSTTHGFTVDFVRGGTVHINCVAYRSGTYGFVESVSQSGGAILLNCASGKHTSGSINGYSNNTSLQRLGFVTLTATDNDGPFNDPTNGDFSLDDVANGGSTGGGAALRAAGFPGVFEGGTTTGYQDIGAVQHADPASGGTVLVHRRRSVR
jgi:hypothetical protein